MHRARVSRLCIHTLSTKYQLIILSENYNTPILTGVTTILANLSNSQFTTILFFVYESRPHRSYNPLHANVARTRQTPAAAFCAPNTSTRVYNSFLYARILVALNTHMMLTIISNMSCTWSGHRVEPEMTPSQYMTFHLWHQCATTQQYLNCR